MHWFYGLVLWTGERWHRFNVIKLALNIKSQNLAQNAIDFDKNMLKVIEKLPASKLRISGLLFAFIGFLIVWYLKR